jgi:putative N6-adenine-specific DNA methylase
VSPPPRAGRKTEITWYDAWAIAAPGLEALLAAELKALGFIDATASAGGVAFRCDAYGLAKAQLWSRIASRVIVRLGSFHASAFHELERGARKVAWPRVIAPGRAVALRVTCRKSKLYHSDAVAQRVAEAIPRAVAGVTFAAGAEVDSFAEDAEVREQLVIVRIDHDQCTISADASGELLHRRGYRLAVGRAPLRETLAAAMLASAKWDPATPLLDPMCGSGTIPIEAAMLARRIAPGLARTFAAEEWPELDLAAFTDARIATRARALPCAPAPILASDRDAGAVEAARANALRAGVGNDIEFSQRALSAVEPRDPGTRGLVIANPPYGVRVGEKEPLRDLFARLGQVARERFAGWQVALLSADKELEAQVGIRFDERLRTSNGGIPVRLVSGTA